MMKRRKKKMRRRRKKMRRRRKRMKMRRREKPQRKKRVIQTWIQLPLRLVANVQFYSC